MSHWLLKARSALLHDNASTLDAARKLAVVNGLGEHSRAQVCLPGLLCSWHYKVGSCTLQNVFTDVLVVRGQPHSNTAWVLDVQASWSRPAVVVVQGHSAAVKEAVGASLLGCKAPFRLMQDHSRSGRLEASTLALRKWLFSEHFERYLSLLQVCAGSPVLCPPVTYTHPPMES